MILENKVIAVIGLGYVGLPLAVEFGKKYKVIGFDINTNRINELSRGEDNTLEINSKQINESKKLEFSSDIDYLKSAQIFIITVPTPIDIAKRPDLRPLIKSSEMVGRLLKKDDIVIYESTVYPGCTEEICVPLLEKSSGLIFNKDFFCGYSPERINPGDKVNTITKIKKITSGSNTFSLEVIDRLYSSIITAGTYKVSSIKVAEAAKVIENTQRDLNIALVNELSVLFDRLDIDTIEVLEAAGTKWNFLPFRPGMVGGHCIGVDPYYLTHKAEEVGYHPQIIAAGRRINDNMSRYAARNVIKLMINNGINVSESKVGVMGVTFKEDCPDIRNSKVIDLVKEFEVWGIEVVITDPYANAEELKNEFGYELVKRAELPLLDALVIAVGHQEYRNLDPKSFKNIFKSEKPVIADLKAIYDKKTVQQNFTLFRF